MGAHVSASPNHQTGRESSLSVRYQVARQFNLGYELNLECVDKNEVEEIRNQIEAYKVDRNWMKEGQFYHHDTNQNYVMWSTVSKNVWLWFLENVMIFLVLMKFFIFWVLILIGIITWNRMEKSMVEMN